MVSRSSITRRGFLDCDMLMSGLSVMKCGGNFPTEIYRVLTREARLGIS
jgi:hypothetical protein